jgi:iron(III) transport system ATP-binding protein
MPALNALVRPCNSPRLAPMSLALDTMTAPPALRLDSIRHRFGDVVAVDGVSLEARAGEILCLLGPSGCGKSTLLRLAAGLEPLSSGRVDIDGVCIAGPDRQPMPPEQRAIGLVFQDYALFPHLSARANVEFGLKGLSAPQRRAQAMEALSQVRMQDFAESFPHQLSGGQQQRVALARALAPRPRVLLLDEPFSGLDQRLRGQVRDDTLHVLKRAGIAAIMVTHDPEEAMFLADRIALMRAGRIEQEGRPEDLYLRPATPFAAEFFGDINHMEGTVQGGQVATPLGSLPAPGYADGAPVLVLARPEALRLAAFDAGVLCGTVMAARLLGRTSLVHLSMGAPGGGVAHIHARIAGVFTPADGTLVCVQLDPSQVHIFPRPAPASTKP